MPPPRGVDKRDKRKRDRDPSTVSQPLEAQLEEDKVAKLKTKKKSKPEKAHQEEEDMMSAEISKKVMREARKQMEEVGAEERAKDKDAVQAIGTGQVGRATLNAAAFKADEYSDGEEGDFSDFDEDEDYEEEEVEITEEEEALISKFMNPKAEAGRNLADLILERIREKEESGELPSSTGMDTSGPRPVPGMDPKVTEVYTEIGKIFSRYKAGKVPKAFKIIPSLAKWEEVLYLTGPDSWTPHAMYQATRLFASNLNPRMAQRFFNMVLLPAVREDIQSNKKLHFALFQALKKATYKPAAFYKGMVLPLLSSGSCTVREAVIWSSLLSRVSIPVLHSAVAILKIAEMPYSGTTSFFLQVMLLKKYALPHRVIDALVENFMKFEDEDRAVPVVWHQSLLTFVQRYKHDIKAEDKTRIRRLLKVQNHYLMTQEIHRELNHGRSRGEADPETDGMSMDTYATGTAVVENPREMPPIVMDEDI